MTKWARLNSHVNILAYVTETADAWPNVSGMDSFVIHPLIITSDFLPKTILQNYFRNLKIVFKTILKIENRIVLYFQNSFDYFQNTILPNTGSMCCGRFGSSYSMGRI
jgi:hypothetical protein